MEHETERMITLPPPSTRGRVSIEEALSTRRSGREYARRDLTEFEIAQLAWAGQGITAPAGLRTAPSAGALYPLEIYLANGDGVFRYEPRGHRLAQLSRHDHRRALAAAALGQEELVEAAATFALTADYERSERKYGHARGERYTVLEAGHAAQNMLLQAAAMGLAGVPIGAFDDAAVRDALGLPPEHEPLYLLPIGYPR